MVGDFKFSWDDFEATAPNTFRQLWKDEDFADVTLATQDYVQIKAHKVILSASSHLFREILLKNSHKNPLLYFHNLKSSEIKHIMKFIYLGQCEVGQNGLVAFLAAGKELMVKGLTEGSDIEKETSVDEIVQIDLKKEHDESPYEHITVDEKDYEEERSVEYPESFLEFAETQSTQMHEAKDPNVGALTIPSDYNTGQKEHKKDAININTNISNNYSNVNEKLQYSCDKCEYKSGKKILLLKHFVKKHDVVHKCDKCEYIASNMEILKTHTLYVHSGAKFLCDRCEYKGSSPGSVKTHIEIKHPGMPLPINVTMVMPNQKQLSDDIEEKKE